jgi:hypothetical protein
MSAMLHKLLTEYLAELENVIKSLTDTLSNAMLSYRSLDVEHIGSVYEAMMGFTLLRAPGPMIAIKSAKASGAAVMINLAALLATAPPKRAAWLKEQTDPVLTGTALSALPSAKTVEDLLAALGSKIDHAATPDNVAGYAVHNCPVLIAGTLTAREFS